jgi:hypothetical protein
MRRASPALAVPALLLAACGMREPLRLAPGEQAVQRPAMASRPLTTDEMLAQTPVARPERVDELLRRSEEREDDRFDLPPGDIPVADGGDDNEAPE